MVRLKPIIAAKTDIGLYRKSNEDAVFTHVSSSNNCALLIVADGMGGIEVGNIASQLVIDTIFGEIQDLLEEIASKFSEEYLIERFYLAFQKVNLALEERQPSGMPLSSTVSCAFVQDNKAIVMNIADCRTYHFRDNQLHLITKNRPFMIGEPSAIDIRVDYGAPLGAGYEIYVNKYSQVDEPISDPKLLSFVLLNFWKQPLQAGDRLLICSDGLWIEIGDSEIEGCLSSSPTPQEATRRLIDAAKVKGGRDNISAIVCEMAVNHE